MWTMAEQQKQQQQQWDESVLSTFMERTASTMRKHPVSKQYKRKEAHTYAGIQERSSVACCRCRRTNSHHQRHCQHYHQQHLCIQRHCPDTNHNNKLLSCHTNPMSAALIMRFHSKLTIRQDSVVGHQRQGQNTAMGKTTMTKWRLTLVVCLSTASSKVSWTHVQVLAIHCDQQQQQQNDEDATECKRQNMRIWGRKL